MKILITGAGGGIAKQVAITLAKKKHTVFLTCHTSEQVKKLKKEFIDIKNINIMKIDITNSYDQKKVLLLNVDVLYNHAGICQGGSILEANINDVRNNFEVNVFSSFDLLQKVLQQMIKKNKGRIIIMSSLTAIMPIPFVSIYSATKASISTITKMLQFELNLINKNIEIVLIEPGMYHTGFNDLFLNNKYNGGIYFNKIKNKIYKYEHLFFKLGEKKELRSIVNKIIKGIESKHPKKIYRAPFFQALFAKFINIFW